VKILTNQDVADLLDYRECLKVVENTFFDLAQGNATNRPRTHTYSRWGGGESVYCFKSMDGALPRYNVHAIRMASNHIVYTEEHGKKRHDEVPDAPGKKYVGLIMLFSMSTLEPLCILHDGYVSYMRVGVTSALAAKALSREDSRVVGLFGTGHLARRQIPALCLVRPIEKVYIYSPNPDHRRAYRKEVQPLVDAELIESDNPRDLIDHADIVVCATNAEEPVFDGRWLAAGQHVNSVMSAELDPMVNERADIIGIRAWEKSLPYYPPGLSSPRGEEATYNPSLEKKMRDLGSILAGKLEGRTDPSQVTMFGGSGTGPSSGLGLQFAAVGQLVYRKALELGRGYDVPSDLFLEDVHP
jgi:ornithine cyclodeaminase/alanine dehydrogenase-like protein (mu-crystallin family)